MNSPKLFNLAEILMAEALISDTSLPKQQLANCLGVSRPTVQRYDSVCYWEVQDYRESYPLLPKDEWLIRKCKHDRTVPLNPYQIYVLSMVCEAFKHLGKEKIVRDYIKQNGYLFSKAKYENRLRQLAKEVQKTA